ncbi:MAG: hypothetical protein KKF62_01805 [Bacteroidetes bacterium]|nr:hypothetical protein [Bacteroidota bacterium]MBU1116333.1 hypothetical protein [Bacteroidota bacterium]MBU1796906.1 hypothetical protein [Bacteroidota bacterium]
MKHKFNLVFFSLVILTSFSFSQPILERYNNLGKMYVAEFSSAPFPHLERDNGHKYDNKSFPKEEHYNDSSVAIFIPKNFEQKFETNFVVYFHGWNNNIDSACAQFNLIEQFSESNKNAIFIFPEGPKNSPDSFGGKLEQKDGLKNLINDIVKFLLEKGEINSSKVGNIILAGHSGAFRVISFCLMRGGLTKNISDVILFDALYAHTEKYAYWIDNFNGRFINIYTNDGGTKSETENLMDDLVGWEIPYFQTDESKLKIDDLTNNRLIFIHSDLSHNEVIAKRNQFYKFLKTSKVGEK